MTRRAWLRGSVLLLLLTLAAPPASAGGLDPMKEVRDVFAWIWQGLGGIVPAIDQGVSTIDPNGQPTSGPAAPGDSANEEADGGWTIDPDG
ncbi:MAG TPA: hypothetical protein VF756_07555 [Thermoanaerobaculia bacterium]